MVRMRWRQWDLTSQSGQEWRRMVVRARGRRTANASAPHRSGGYVPGAVDASMRGRTTAHLRPCAQPSASAHARLSTWSMHQLTSAAIQEWEVEAAIGWLKAGTAPGEEGVTPDMVVAAGQPMRRVLIGLFNKCWKVGLYRLDGGKRVSACCTNGTASTSVLTIEGPHCWTS
jgi:hypothetical protein